MPPLIGKLWGFFWTISNTKNNYRGDMYTLLNTVLTFGFSQKLLNVFGQIKTKN